MRVLITDDHQLFLDGVRHILEKLDSAVEITESTSADHTIEILESGQQFDLILIDLSMPGIDGMSILQRMHERKVWLPMVVVSAEEDAYKIKSALDSGALGFIPKSHSSQQMIAALQAILEGEIYIPEAIEKQINILEARRTLAESSEKHILDSGCITRRQHDVLQLMAKGYSNKQIATSLFLTEHTVKSHIRSLFLALHARNRTECVQIAIQQNAL